MNGRSIFVARKRETKCSSMIHFSGSSHQQTRAVIVKEKRSAETGGSAHELNTRTFRSSVDKETFGLLLKY